uniref:DNA mismatch repair protein MSH3 n=1 Tax=Blastobotrys adeninivorans TaxID=409370 RepID=A0A060TCH1_BLAAD
MSGYQTSIGSFFTKKKDPGSLKRSLNGKDDDKQIKRPALAVGQQEPTSNENVSSLKFRHTTSLKEHSKEFLDRRERFKKKLGHPGSIEAIKRRNRRKDEQSPGEILPLKPYQQQLRDLKLKYPDVILLIEEGYKYKVIGTDAAIVSRIAGTMLIPGRMHFDDGHPEDAGYDTFAYCVFQEQSLESYIKRIIQLGLKVGVVNQMETASIKAAGDSRNKPMVRQLTRLCSQATYVDGNQSSAEYQVERKSLSSDYVLAICADGKSFSIVAAQVSTGDVIYDHFDDTPALTELETRLLHIQPCEVIVSGPLDEVAMKLVRNLPVSEGKLQVVEWDKPDTDELSRFLYDYYFELERNGDIPATQFEIVREFGGGIKQCLYSIIKYLQEFGLDSVFHFAQNFASFQSKSCMNLNGNTLSSLEVFYNNTTYTLKGSLFEILDHTNTAYGQRLLRKWVGKPLVNKKALETRLDAISELKSGYNGTIDQIKRAMKSSMDLEKGITNIYHKRSSRKQLYHVLYNLHKISTLFNEEHVDSHGFKSPYLMSLLKALPTCAESTASFLKKINEKSISDKSLSDNKLKRQFFNDEENDDIEEFEEIFVKKAEIAQIQSQLHQYLHEVKAELKLPDLKFDTFKDEEFLLVVKASSGKKVPKEWIKHSATKEVQRFESSRSRQLVQQLNLCREQLQAACELAYKHFLGEVSKCYSEFRTVVMALAELDCLMSLAAVASLPHYSRAKFIDEPSLKIEEGYHPMAQFTVQGAYIPNDTCITTTDSRASIVTGPNMGGKSSYVRQVALLAIMAQIGSYVPAKSMELGIIDAIFTRMGAYDNMLSGKSTFMVELEECSAIMARATERSLVILDEIGRGTSTHDGEAIAFAVLSYFITVPKSLTLFITHYPNICSLETEFPGEVQSYHMGYKEVDETDVVLLYKLERGIAHRSYGLNVAKLAGLPSGVIQAAQAKSQDFENKIRQQHEYMDLWKNLHVLRALKGDNASEQLIQFIE